MSKMLKDHSLVFGIILMFLLTWPIDLINAAYSQDWISFQIPLFPAVLLGYGFVIGAGVMTLATEGKERTKLLFKKYLHWKVAFRWYLYAFLLVPVLTLIAVIAGFKMQSEPISFDEVLAHNLFGDDINLVVFVIPFFFFDLLTNGEEIGWRGYIQPRLQSKQSPIISYLIVGILSVIWHFPKFLYAGDTKVFGPIYVIEAVSFAIILGFLYDRTGSLLLVTIMHASKNTSGVFLPLQFNDTTLTSTNTIFTTLLTLTGLLIIFTNYHKPILSEDSLPVTTL